MVKYAVLTKKQYYLLFYLMVCHSIVHGSIYSYGNRRKRSEVVYIIILQVRVHLQTFALPVITVITIVRKKSKSR